MEEKDLSNAAQSGQPGRRRFWKRMGIGAAIGVALAGVGASVFAHGGPGGSWGGGPGGWHARQDMSPELRAKHLDLMVERMLDGIDVSAEQKSRINAIVGEMAKEMEPLRQQRRDARREAIEILTKPTVDRAAIEAYRVEKLKLADAASKRFTQGIADIAEVLTSEQRTALAEKFSRRHGPR